MKTLNFLQDIDNRLIIPAPIKKQFVHKGFNFAVVKPTFESINNDGVSHSYLVLVHFESGGKLPMYLPTNKTIKDYVSKSINSIDILIDRIGLSEFQKVLNKQSKIN